jgi:nucleotide-binding universal stress UspA family protein
VATHFLIGFGTAIGVLLLVVVAGLLVRYYSPRLFRPHTRLFKKVLVASVGAPFSRVALEMATRLAGDDGILETVYIVEVPMDQPLDGSFESELSRGMVALEEAGRMAKRKGRSPVPRMERSRLGSKTIVEIQKNEDFDVVVLSAKPDTKTQKESSKMSEYIRENAGCTVIDVLEKKPE